MVENGIYIIKTNRKQYRKALPIQCHRKILTLWHRRYSTMLNAVDIDAD